MDLSLLIINALHNTGTLAVLSGIFMLLMVVSGAAAAKRKVAAHLKAEQLRHKELQLVRQLRVKLLQDEIIRMSPSNVWGQINTICEDFIAEQKDTMPQ